MSKQYGVVYARRASTKWGAHPPTHWARLKPHTIKSFSYHKGTTERTYLTPDSKTLCGVWAATYIEGGELASIGATCPTCQRRRTKEERES